MIDSVRSWSRVRITFATYEWSRMQGNFIKLELFSFLLFQQLLSWHQNIQHQNAHVLVLFISATFTSETASSTIFSVRSVSWMTASLENLQYASFCNLRINVGGFVKMNWYGASPVDTNTLEMTVKTNRRYDEMLCMLACVRLIAEFG